MDIKEIQKLSKNFRVIASRLLNSRYEDAMDNLIRFINFVDNDEMISGFISKNNNTQFDIEKIIKERGYDERYPTQFKISEEIAFTYQLLKYATKNFDDYFRISEGYSGSRKLQDHNDEFNSVVVNPFIQYILVYLHELYVDSTTDSSIGRVSVNVAGENKGLITVTQGGTSNVSGNVINNQDVTDISELIESILMKIDNDNSLGNKKDEVIETLNEIKGQISSSKPNKKFLSMLKDELNTIASIVTIATTLSGPLKSLYILISQYLANI